MDLEKHARFIMSATGDVVRRHKKFDEDRADYTRNWRLVSDDEAREGLRELGVGDAGLQALGLLDGHKPRKSRTPAPAAELTTLLDNSNEDLGSEE